ncbi:DUF3795 domain-containing protein [bacterium]|nr:DUF3795 domain-containing protein [bacterium]
MGFRFDSYCGLYCGACGVIHAVEKATLAEFAKKWNSTADKIECYGCKSEHVAEFARSCRIRECAREKGLEFCIECDDFQCERFMDFLEANAAHPRIHLDNLERIKEAGLDAWLSEQKKRWSCPDCGRKFHFDEATCVQCGAKLYNLADEAEDMKKEA